MASVTSRSGLLDSLFESANHTTMFAPLRLITLLALATMAPGVTAQLSPDPRPAYPPDGQRLRVLADRLSLQIGYASRYNWPELAQATLYEEIVSQEFNIATPENSMKWEFIEPVQNQFDFTDMDRLRSFADTHGMALHGHPLLWYRQNPLWAQSLPAEQVKSAMQGHIEAVVQRYQGRVEVWDVVNEGLADDGESLRPNLFLDALGPSYIDQAFQQACLSDPHASLLYNDYDVGWLTPKSDAMLDLVTELQQREVPIDGVGFQMHIDHTFEHFEGFSSNMQRFADRDLDIYLTELDVAVLEQPEQYPEQADVYANIVQRCLMQPRCQAVQIWGVDDFHSWRPFFDPLLFDDDFHVKPAYFGIQRALQTQPIHPEHCDVGDSVVESGTVYPGQNSIQCTDVPLGAEYNSVLIRYRNPGVDTPAMTIKAGELLLATVALPPTISTDEGDYVTVDVPLEAVKSSQNLLLSFSGNTQSIGIDALLFTEPDGIAQSAATNRATGVNRPNRASRERDCLANRDAEGTNGGTTGTADSGGGGGFGAPSWLLMSCLLLPLYRRKYV